MVGMVSPGKARLHWNLLRYRQCNTQRIRRLLAKSDRRAHKFRLLIGKRNADACLRRLSYSHPMKTRQNHWAYEQSVLTHGEDAARATGWFGRLLFKTAISGFDIASIPADVLNRKRNKVTSSGFYRDTLEAAMWGATPFWLVRSGYGRVGRYEIATA